MSGWRVRFLNVALGVVFLTVFVGSIADLTDAVCQQFWLRAAAPELSWWQRNLLPADHPVVVTYQMQGWHRILVWLGWSPVVGLTLLGLTCIGETWCNPVSWWGRVRSWGKARAARWSGHRRGRSGS